MTYQECLKEIEALQGRGIHRGLERVTAACQILKNPQNIFPSVHIAGTNGKGSTAAITAEILRRARFRTGFTLSPHVENFRERIQINGEWIPTTAVVEFHTMLKRRVGHIPLTYFEWVTLMAFLYFAHSRVDMAVLECGMGGRWDATSVALPLVAALTNVRLDHQDFLGSTVEDILAEKLEIFKPGVTAWTGLEDLRLLAIAHEHCRKLGIPFYVLSEYFRENEGDDFSVFDYRGLSCGLKGAHQKKNGALAVAICRSLGDRGYRIPRHAVEEGLLKVRWPGRLETLQTSPTILLDGAHNLAAVEALAQFLKREGKPYHLVFGALKDRPFVDMAKILIPHAKTVLWAAFEDARSYSRNELEILARTIDAPQSRGVLEVTAEKWGEFVKTIQPTESILVAGSLYLVSQVRSIYRG